MALLRDAIGSALGGSQVNNGLSGPRLPFRNGKNRQTGWLPSSVIQQSPCSGQRDGYYTNESNEGSSPVTMCSASEPRHLYEQIQQREATAWHRYSDEPPCYDDSERWGGNQERFHDERPRNMRQSYGLKKPDEVNCCPVALPQIGYGDEQPFLRGYSSDLGRYGISELEFIKLVDAINVAIIPNPENQIFQKGANIAGWFV